MTELPASLHDAFGDEHPTVRVYNDALTHVALEFHEADQAQELYEFFIDLYQEAPPRSRVIVELSGGPFSFYQHIFLAEDYSPDAED